MKISSAFFVLSFFLFTSKLHGQKKEDFATAHIMFDDGTKSTATINLYEFLNNNRLGNIRKVSQVEIDSTIYFIKAVTNLKDTLKVVERVVEGKISIYISSARTQKEEIFAEKEGVFYELRLLKKDIDGRTYQVKEYASYLTMLMRDCSTVDSERLSKLNYSLAGIQELVNNYNQSCGWQKEIQAKAKLKSKLTYGILAGGMFTSMKLSYRENTPQYTGKGTINAAFAGGYIKVNFPKFRSSSLLADISFEKIGGTGKAYTNSMSGRHDHKYNIIATRQTTSANIALVKSGDLTLSLGIALSFKLMLVNNSEYKSTTRSNTNKEEYHSSNDVFDFNPGGNVIFEYKNVGFRYQLLGLSIYQKAIELYHFDHRFSLLYKLREK